MTRGVPPLRTGLVGVAIAFSACGGTSSPPSDPPRSETTPIAQKAATNTEKPCELLTRSDAEAILASPIEDDVDEGPIPMGDKVLLGRCYYEGDGGSVALSVAKHVDTAYAAERFAKLRDRHDTDPSFRAMPDLGEGGFAEHDMLHVKRGDLLLTIELRRTGERKLKHYADKASLDTLAAEKREIAAEILKRLPPVTGV